MTDWAIFQPMLDALKSAFYWIIGWLAHQVCPWVHKIFDALPELSPVVTAQIADALAAANAWIPLQECISIVGAYWAFLAVLGPVKKAARLIPGVG